MNGKIQHFNKTARIFFKGGLEKIVGMDFAAFLVPEDRGTFKHILEVETTLQPFAAHGIQLQGLADPTMLRIYKHPKEGYCLVLLESLQVNEEVLVAREERKWAERLQIMLFGISHELKTPLAIARGYTEVLQQGEQGAVADKVMDTLGRVSEILNNMTEPIRELNEQHDRIDLGHSIEHYCRTMFYIEPGKRYIGHFEADIEYGVGKVVRLSKSRFYQTLTNLFDNAIRATDHLATDARMEIRTRACEKTHHHHCVVMEFEDNGCGMDEEATQNVFAPYFTTRERDTGTGLGGYFIYQFVMDAGGSIEVDSEPGQGTTFTLHLPCTYPT